MSRFTVLCILVACSNPPEPAVVAGPNLVLHAEAVDLGAVTCGNAHAATIAVSNSGDAPLELAIASTLADVTVAPASVTLEPLETVDLAITGRVPAVAQPGFVSSGDLVFTSSLGATTVPVTMAAAGVIVRVDSTVDFGELLPNARLEKRLSVSAEGTAGATVTLAAPTSSVFAIVGGASATLAAGESHAFTLRMQAPSELGPRQAELPIAISGDLCAAAPAAVALRGTSTNALVTIDRTAIDFGTVGCTASGKAPITIGNAGPTLTDYRASLVGSLNPALSLFFSTGDVVPEDTVTLPFFCSAALAPGSYASDLTVSVNAGSITRHIPVTATIVRADIELSTNQIDLGTVHAQVPITRTVEIRNTGNVATAIRAEGTLAVSLSPASFQLAAGASATVVATIVPSAEDIGRGRIDLGFGAVDGDCNGIGIEVLGSVVP